MRQPQRQRRSIAIVPGVLLAIAFALAAVAELPEREDGHRPLRANPPAESPSAEPAESFTGYPGAPDLTVVSRLDKLTWHPCSNCHSAMPTNPERRELMAPHQAALDHGDGRIWCLDCHAPESRDQLATLAGERVSFDQADRVCAQCHADVHQDWTFGVHGKRVGRWQGPREIYSCAHCHDPHDPGLRPRAPEPPPPVRAGLDPMPHHGHHTPLYPWFSEESAEPVQPGQESKNEEDAAG